MRMKPITVDVSSNASRVGGSALIAATVLFAAVFTYLANSFDYPAVLNRPAADVLPRLLALGATGRAVWILYGLIPFLLIPTAMGVSAATKEAAPRAAQLSVITAVLAAFSMSLGLLRWPSLQWQLAVAHADASAAARESIAIAFAAANSYLGNFIGEFLGELSLNAFFLSASVALARAGGPSRRWVLYAGSAATLLGFVAMLRNATPTVAPFAAANNLVLPIWMLVLGVTLVRYRPNLIQPRE
jgi:Domain of unknown function (DUF4386)